MSELEVKSAVLDVERAAEYLHLAYMTLTMLQQSKAITPDEFIGLQNTKTTIDCVCDYLDKIRERLLSK